MRRTLLAAAVLALASTTLGRPNVEAVPKPRFTEFVGAVHNHSSYSDGWPGTTPATYFASGKAYGLDFLASGEHSDNADVPVTFNEGCLGPLITGCVTTELDRWDATARHAREATTPDFTALRGFEWTSDRFGHINVYFSQHDANAKIDGGYATMDAFYDWFTSDPAEGGGGDGLATFNHPGDKKLTDEPAVNWNDFAYVPSADARMVGIELYNDDEEYGEEFYVHALDKGWHLGAVGAEDLHGTPGNRDDYGSARWAKTVILATDRSEAALKSAMLARRFYAIRRNDGHRLEFAVDHEPMGSRLVRAAGAPLHIVAKTNKSDALVEIVTSGGTVVASGTKVVDVTIAAKAAHRYYFMRVKQGDDWTAFGSPVWVSSAGGAVAGQWLAGDLHVHTCYSHDAYCPPDDDNTGPDEFYTFSGDVSERFTEASIRGLDYLAITDHNDVRSISHTGFGSMGVIGIPGYENSLRGHAQMLGADHLYDNGDRSAAAVNAIADQLRAAGGVFQANHPADGLLVPLDDCSATGNLDWEYGYDVRPDTIEVWNIGHVLQPPMPAGNSNDDSERYWECWLNDGVRIGATGGSDSHWLTLSLVQGPGNPTTWVFAPNRTAAGVLQGLREGRTSISFVPPALGGLRLILEADVDGDGDYESAIGDDVPPRTPMRVRAEGSPGAGILEIRANGRTRSTGTLAPGSAVTFTAPAEGGWVRARLLGPDLRDERATTCDPLVGDGTTYCRDHLTVLALTSPIYVSG